MFCSVKSQMSQCLLLNNLSLSPLICNAGFLIYCVSILNGFISRLLLFCYLSIPKPKHREGNGTPLQYPCLENLMGGGAWQATVHGVAKSQKQLSDFTFTFHFHALEKEMATHSSVLAWRIPGTQEPGGLLSMGSHRVGHD